MKITHTTDSINGQTNGTEIDYIAPESDIDRIILASTRPGSIAAPYCDEAQSPHPIPSALCLDERYVGELARHVPPRRRSGPMVRLVAVEPVVIREGGLVAARHDWLVTIETATRTIEALASRGIDGVLYPDDDIDTGAVDRMFADIDLSSLPINDDDECCAAPNARKAGLA